MLACIFLMYMPKSKGHFPRCLAALGSTVTSSSLWVTRGNIEVGVFLPPIQWRPTLFWSTQEKLLDGKTLLPKMCVCASEYNFDLPNKLLRKLCQQNWPVAGFKSSLALPATGSRATSIEQEGFFDCCRKIRKQKFEIFASFIHVSPVEVCHPEIAELDFCIQSTV